MRVTSSAQARLDSVVAAQGACSRPGRSVAGCRCIGCSLRAARLARQDIFSTKVTGPRPYSPDAGSRPLIWLVLRGGAFPSRSRTSDEEYVSSVYIRPVRKFLLALVMWCGGRVVLLLSVAQNDGTSPEAARGQSLGPKALDVPRARPRLQPAAAAC